MTEALQTTITALNKITKDYFGIDYWGSGRLNSVNANPDTRELAFRHWERVFCYELYHQIRKIIDKKIGTGDNAQFWNKVKLQGELQKMQLDEMTLAGLNLIQLEKKYIPDLIIHKIDTSEEQELVIEVKTKAGISFREYFSDLQKLNEFIEKYRFKNGLFIIANNDSHSIEQQLIINNDEINEKLTANSISKIYITSIKDENETVTAKRLSDILNN